MRLNDSHARLHLLRPPSPFPIYGRLSIVEDFCQNPFSSLFKKNPPTHRPDRQIVKKGVLNIALGHCCCGELEWQKSDLLRALGTGTRLRLPLLVPTLVDSQQLRLRIAVQGCARGEFHPKIQLFECAHARFVCGCGGLRGGWGARRMPHIRSCTVRRLMSNQGLYCAANVSTHMSVHQSCSSPWR